MSHRDQYPSGVPCWVDTAQPDPEAALEFYGALFGWDFAGPGAMPGDPPGAYYVARLRGRDVAGISSQPPGAPMPAAWMTYIAVDSAEEVARRAREAGGRVVVEPFDAAPAGRMAVLRDPAGAAFCIWQADVRQGAQIVNEPSAWAMSVLTTRDPQGAAAFYCALFGWETEPFGPGTTLLRRPGYVGGEPQQPVARDVVAVIRALDAEQEWSVDFWVADIDVAVATAGAGGGTVIVAPREIPGFRNAVIGDPQGAVLSVSQLHA